MRKVRTLKNIMENIHIIFINIINLQQKKYTYNDVVKLCKLYIV